jgi:hypothetical protein
MNRRTFLKLTGIAALAPSLPTPKPQYHQVPAEIPIWFTDEDGSSHFYLYTLQDENNNTVYYAWQRIWPDGDETLYYVYLNGPLEVVVPTPLARSPLRDVTT